MPDESSRQTVLIRCRGHSNIRGTHTKTLELTGDSEITEAGTCIVGVDCRYDEDALLQLRGAVRVRLMCNGIEDSFSARINPLFRRGDTIIFRRNPDPGPRTFSVGASKGASMLSRDLVAELKQPHAELIVEIKSEAAQDHAGGALFVVGTPIGNEADISMRALDTLQSVDLIAAEDTRTIKAFLKCHGIKCKAVSFHDHNERSRTPQLIERLLRGERIALVSEAGMPLLSDPGFNLVRAAHDENVLVTVVPGPDAVTAALAVAGIAPNDFRFVGFLPRKKGARQRLFADLKPAAYTTVFFEAPHRILESLADMQDILGDRDVVVCKNLTKFGEDILRGAPREVSEAIESRGQPRGELAVVLSGADVSEEAIDGEGLGGDFLKMIEALKRDGVPTKTIASAVSNAGSLSRKQAYDIIVGLK